jgi:hypothetical protein
MIPVFEHVQNALIPTSCQVEFEHVQIAEVVSSNEKWPIIHSKLFPIIFGADWTLCLWG